MVLVTVWSDIHCPWATVTVHRLRAAREARGLDVRFDPRPWPLELVNRQGTPRAIVTTEAAVLANHEPDLFSAYRNASWPSTFLPAFELVAAARRLYGVPGAEEVDWALRRAFFRHGVDVSVAAGLARALELVSPTPGFDAEEVLRVWRSEPVRADVFADYERSARLPIQGSPQVFWPDGSTVHNPGLTEHTWVRGIPRVHVDDRQLPGRLLAQALGLVEATSPAEGTEDHHGEQR
ncbi:MAG: DsbA family oxidoreductase [Actinomycetota bacterium]